MFLGKPTNIFIHQQFCIGYPLPLKLTSYYIQQLFLKFPVNGERKRKTKITC